MIGRRAPDRGIALRAAMRETRPWWIRRSGTLYQFIRELGGGEYLAYDFWPLPVPNGDTLTQLGQARIGIPMLSQDDGKNATYSGTWVHGIGPTETDGYLRVAVTGVSMTSGQYVVTATGGDFHSGHVGRRVVIAGAGSGGSALTATITSVSSATQFNVGSSCQTTIADSTLVMWPGYRYSTTAASTATWTSPTATDLGVRIVTGVFGGLFAVAIDGSATAANKLPTAQEKVDAGAYPSTILVANGGTLNPTDRVLDCYSSSTNWDKPTAIAQGLASAAHTVVLTATAYTRTGATDKRAYVTGWTYGDGTQTPATAGAAVAEASFTQPSYSAHSYAYRIYPTGGSEVADGGFIGTVHGYEVETGLTFNVDGTPTTIADGTTVAVASSAAITRVSYMRHPDYGGGTAHYVDITTVLTLDGEGFTIEHTDTHNAAGWRKGGYPAMLPLGSLYDRFTTSGMFKNTAVRDANGTRKGESAAWIGVAWDEDGKHAASLEVTAPLGTLGAGYNNPPSPPIYIEDRAVISGTKINKVYVPWSGTNEAPVAIASGEVWHWKARYRFRRFANGAHATLNRI